MATYLLSLLGVTEHKSSLFTQRKASIWCRLLNLALSPGFLVLADGKKCFVRAWKGIFTFTEERKAMGHPGWNWNATLAVQPRTPGARCALPGAQHIPAPCQAETQE